MQIEPRRYPPKSSHWDGHWSPLKSKPHSRKRPQPQAPEPEGMAYTHTERTVKKYTHKDVVTAVRNILEMRNCQFQSFYTEKHLKTAPELLTLVELNQISAEIVDEHLYPTLRVKSA